MTSKRHFVIYLVRIKLAFLKAKAYCICIIIIAFALSERHRNRHAHPGCRFACPGLSAPLGFQPAFAKSEFQYITYYVKFRMVTILKT